MQSTCLIPAKTQKEKSFQKEELRVCTRAIQAEQPPQTGIYLGSIAYFSTPCGRFGSDGFELCATQLQSLLE